MTRNQLIKHWNVIVAFKEGKDIQGKVGYKWWDIPECSFYENGEYRIKPEPKLVPFTHEDIESIKGRYIHEKGNDEVLIKFTKIKVNSNELIWAGPYLDLIFF